MSALNDIIVNRVKAHGPLTVSDYMIDCLMHPDHGYYQQETVFGADGDFITAPEVSQMFGEVIGLWLVEQWRSLGSPTSFNLVEFGPGRGTLMVDILRSSKNTPKFLRAARIFFVERSDKMRKEQKQNVPHANWLRDVDELYAGPTLVVANEFFDALPIHQFQKHEGEWLERMITIDDHDALKWTLASPSAAVSMIPSTLVYKEQGSIVEICPAALRITSTIAKHLAKNRGAALFIDYGYDRSSVGDTFQAMRGHAFTDPLATPGKADLTAHVNFDLIAIAAATNGMVAHGPIAQGAFLMSLGMGERAMKLVENLDDKGQEQLLSSLKRLTAPDEMGELFRVVALIGAGQRSVPGF